MAHLSTEPGCPMGHAGLYEALANGHIDTGALEGLLHQVAQATTGESDWYAIDQTPWPRPDAFTVPGRAMQHSAAHATSSGADETGPEG